MKKNRLGKGLDALIPSKKEEQTEDQTQTTAPKAGIVEVDITSIIPNDNQPRKVFDDNALNELTESIRAKGVIQPIVVTEVDGKYMIIAGERRWRASGLAGLKQVPVVVKKVDTEQERLELALIENIQRADLNPVECAEGYKNLIDRYGYKQDDLAKIIGKSRSSIANTMRLLGLDRKILDSVADGIISEGHARAILSIEDEKEHLNFLYLIIDKHLSVREAEKIATKINKGENITEEKKEDEGDVFILSLKDELEGHFNTRINIKNKKKGGTIEIQYSSNDDLDRIIKTIRGV